MKDDHLDGALDKKNINNVIKNIRQAAEDYIRPWRLFVLVKFIDVFISCNIRYDNALLSNSDQIALNLLRFA